VAPVAAGHPPPEKSADLTWLIGGIIGLFISIIWYRLTTMGWQAEKIPLRYAKTFRWANFDNLIDQFELSIENTLDPARKDSFERWALGLIWLFGIAYLLIIASSVYFLIRN